VGVFCLILDFLDERLNTIAVELVGSGAETTGCGPFGTPRANDGS